MKECKTCGYKYEGKVCNICLDREVEFKLNNLRYSCPELENDERFFLKYCSRIFYKAEEDLNHDMILRIRMLWNKYNMGDVFFEDGEYHEW